MDLAAIWPLLEQESRDALVAENGDTLSKAVLDDIARVNGSVPSGAWWGVNEGPDGSSLSDEGVDWIEAVANGEPPRSPRDR